MTSLSHAATQDTSSQTKAVHARKYVGVRAAAIILSLYHIGALYILAGVLTNLKIDHPRAGG